MSNFTLSHERIPLLDQYFFLRKNELFRSNQSHTLSAAARYMTDFVLFSSLKARLTIVCVTSTVWYNSIYLSTGQQLKSISQKAPPKTLYRVDLFSLMDLSLYPGKRTAPAERTIGHEAEQFTKT